jgi:hypothetical protein
MPADYNNAIAFMVITSLVGRIGRNPFVKYWDGEMQSHLLLVQVASAVTTVRKGSVSFDFHIMLSVTMGFVRISGTNFRL